MTCVSYASFFSISLLRFVILILPATYSAPWWSTAARIFVTFLLRQNTLAPPTYACVGVCARVLHLKSAYMHNVVVVTAALVLAVFSICTYEYFWRTKPKLRISISPCPLPPLLELVVYSLLPVSLACTLYVFWALSALCFVILTNFLPSGATASSPPRRSSAECDHSRVSAHKSFCARAGRGSRLLLLSTSVRTTASWSFWSNCFGNVSFLLVALLLFQSPPSQLALLIKH